MEDMAEWYPTLFEQTMANNYVRHNSDISRRIFDDKIAFEREFIRCYLVECTGEYVLHKSNPT